MCDIIDVCIMGVDCCGQCEGGIVGNCGQMLVVCDFVYVDDVDFDGSYVYSVCMMMVVVVVFVSGLCNGSVNGVVLILNMLFFCVVMFFVNDSVVVLKKCIWMLFGWWNRLYLK